MAARPPRPLGHPHSDACDGREETEVDEAWFVFSRSRARNRASVVIRV